MENSLRRLQTDHIDLYQMHRPDPDTDIDETLSALSDLVTSGKVRALGSSTFPAEHIVEAQWVAERRGHERFRSEQPPYSILVRGIEAAVLPTCQRYGMGVIAWSPLNGGWLTGRYRRTPTSTDHRPRAAAAAPVRPGAPREPAKLEAIEELTRSLPTRAAADPPGAGLRARAPGVTSAIIGPRTMDQLTTCWRAPSVALDDDVLDRIDQIVPPGMTLNPADAGWQSPVLADPAARRRPQAARAVGSPAGRPGAWPPRSARARGRATRAPAPG